DMWEKIVLNLLSNALKFTFEGDITVEVRKSADQDEWIELEVRDTGTGIPAEDLPHLFERFYRVQGAQARTHEGTGIGLALVQELVRLHGGTVRVASTPGMGSAFTVIIPTGDAHLPADRVVSRARADEARTRESHVQGVTPFVEEALRWLPEPPLPALPLGEGTAAVTVAAAALDGYVPNVGAQPDGAIGPGADDTSASATQVHTESATILVADDNADMRAYLARLLSARWDVRTVANGADALAAASAQPPDLILADVMMPGMDGFALVAALRDNPRTRALPVILLSARAGEEATVEGLRAGADDYLIKPFSARELLARVQTHLELARVRKETAARAAQLDAVFEAIGDGVLVQDLQGRRTYANRAYRDLLRRHLQMQGHHLDPDTLFAGQAKWEHYVTISDEQDREMLPTEWPTERALRGETLTGANAVDELTYGADGTVMKLNVAAAPIRGAEGQITGAVGVFRDVTVRRQLEQQVAEQAGELEAIFAAQADGVAVFDTEGRFLRSNRALNQIFGMDAETDYTALSLAERMRRVLLFDEQGRRIPEAQWPHWRVLRGEVLAGASAMDARMRTLDGREVWISTTGAPVRSPDGQLIGVVLVTRDVTARRRLERKVAEQASELQTIFEAMTDGVFVLDADGHVTRLNAAAHALFGQTPHDGLAATAEGRVQAIELRDTEGRLLPLMQLPTQRVLRGEVLAGDDALTLMVRTYDERERIISLTGGPLRDATGQITGAVGVVRDVTELRRIESALAEQERLFRTLVENSPDIITRFDRNLRHIYVSPASEAVTGIPAHARLGKTYRQLGLPVGVYALWEHALRRAITTGQQQVFETGYQAAGRPPRVSQVRYIPEFAADGSVESVLGITTDITELKRAEEALRQSEERFAKAFHASPIAMSILSVATSRILDVNAAQLRLAGHSRDEMLGATVGDLDLLAPADLDALSDKWRQEARVYEAPVRIRTKSGKMRSCLCSMASIWVGGEECLIVTTLDVT
ncbi:MAG TPA: PAS domain S-box protein, partial [Ktedonobacterales bacterium]|nr:PAS domain S-box protein [Ktedonobacterales bacterium]